MFRSGDYSAHDLSLENETKGKRHIFSCGAWSYNNDNSFKLENIYTSIYNDLLRIHVANDILKYLTFH